MHVSRFVVRLELIKLFALIFQVLKSSTKKERFGAVIEIEHVASSLSLVPFHSSLLLLDANRAAFVLHRSRTLPDKRNQTIAHFLLVI